MNHLARSKILFNLIVKIWEAARLTGGSISSFFFSYDDGSTPPPVAGGYYAIVRQQQHGTGTFYMLEYILYTLYECLSLDDK